MLPAKVVFAVAASSAAQAFTVKPFKVSLSHEVPRLKDLLAASRLPSNPIVGADNEDFGVSLATLQTLRKEWLAFNWTAEEQRLNSCGTPWMRRQRTNAFIRSYHQYKVELDNMTVHFVHEKSPHPGAIPIIITHGWPGMSLASCGFLSFDVHILQGPLTNTCP